MVCRAREFRDRSLGSVPGTFCYDKADRNEAKLFFEQDRMEVLKSNNWVLLRFSNLKKKNFT